MTPQQLSTTRTTLCRPSRWMTPHQLEVWLSCQIELAMEQDREVLAVPGNITSKNSFGTNYLIKAGAKLVQQWQDVATEFPGEIAAEILPPQIDDEKKPEKKKAEKNDLPKGLSVTEKKVYKTLRADEHKHIDTLLEESKLSVGELNSALVSLDLKDLILVLPGNNYAKKISVARSE